VGVKIHGHQNKNSFNFIFKNESNVLRWEFPMELLIRFPDLGGNSNAFNFLRSK